MIFVLEVLSLLLLPTLAMSQCANEMPSGACCDADGFFTEADPEVFFIVVDLDFWCNENTEISQRLTLGTFHISNKVVNLDFSHMLVQ